VDVIFSAKDVRRSWRQCCRARGRIHRVRNLYGAATFGGADGAVQEVAPELHVTEGGRRQAAHLENVAEVVRACCDSALWNDVDYMVPYPLLPPVLSNHEFRGNFWGWSLNTNDLYQNVVE
jgi:hypothetical protein